MVDGSAVNALCVSFDVSVCSKWVLRGIANHIGYYTQSRSPHSLGIIVIRRADAECVWRERERDTLIEALYDAPQFHAHLVGTSELLYNFTTRAERKVVHAKCMPARTARRGASHSSFLWALG